MTIPRKNIFGSGKIYQIIFIVILVIGIVLRAYHYLMGRNLWEDETHLALNFMKYGFLRLTQPLDDIQAAPILFIMGVKLIVEIFGYGEVAFRALPFIASIMTLPLFYFIIRDLTKNKTVALFGFFIFSVNITLIYFSSELKQYALDVAVYLLMTYLAVGANLYVSKNRTLLLTIAGCFSMLFSSVAFIVLFCIACNYFSEWYRNKKINSGEVKMMFLWAVVFVANYFVFIHNHPSTAHQRTNYAFAFCPTSIFSDEFTAFFSKTIEETFFTKLLYISKLYFFPYVLGLIFLAALVHLIVQKKYTILLFTCVPVILHLGLSALKLYPFWYRLILYLLPCFIFLMALGTYVLAGIITKIVRINVVVVIIPLFGFFFVANSITEFPMWPTKIKPSLDYVNSNYPASHVYILDPVNAYRYYYQRGYAKNEIFKEVPWEIDPAEFYEMTSSETSNYLLFYGTVFQWGYADVLADLKQQGLIANSIEQYGYGIAEIKPQKKTTTGDVLKTINYKNFKSTYEDLIALWGGEVSSDAINLPKGKYKMTIVSKGLPVENIFPHHTVFVNGNLIGDFSNARMFSRVTLPFELTGDTGMVIKIILDNDATKNNEDRNSFIREILITRD